MSLPAADTEHESSADKTLPSPSGEHAVKTLNAGAPHRTTILPRVEWEGEKPKLAATHRLRFEELGLLGEGGMGEVMLVKDHDIERTVALKRIPPAADLGAILRFVEEIRTIGRLEHPNIMPVHDVGVDENGRYYFVMKHLRGETMETIIAKLRAGDREAHARYPFSVRIQIFLGVLNAIAYAHREGFLHRDLKPANIMVGPYGEVTVLDWGLARKLAARDEAVTPPANPRTGTVLETQLGVVMGTPLYMCPEQARGAHDQLDQRSDLYSLAVLFHEFLYLEHYLAGRESIAEVLDGVRTVAPTVFSIKQHPTQPPVPAELGWFVVKGMSKDPAQRYQSADEMVDMLQRIVRGEFRVQCAQTFAKRLLRELACAVDKAPVGTIAGMGVVGALALTGVVMAVLKLMS
ncbi:MAG: serine/threonine-protein kinase [Myxococcota bacterium]|jgi:serine/threonine-protein kinase